nr:hypothetical protein [uncultured Albidiferax sp.]
MDNAQANQINTLRGFVGVLNGYLGSDQSLAQQDAWVGNNPGQYQTIGPYSVGIEGSPVSTMQNGAVVVSPGLVLMLMGAAAVFLWMR